MCCRSKQYHQHRPFLKTNQKKISVEKSIYDWTLVSLDRLQIQLPVNWPHTFQQQQKTNRDKREKKIRNRQKYATYILSKEAYLVWLFHLHFYWSLFSRFGSQLRKVSSNDRQLPPSHNRRLLKIIAMHLPAIMWYTVGSFRLQKVWSMSMHCMALQWPR